MAETPTDLTSREVTRIASGLPWEGYLTLANLDAVADRIKQMLGDGRRYTSVYCNEGMREYFPQVRTGLVAEITVNHRERDGRRYGDITISDGYVSWLNTDAADQAEARARDEKARPSYVRLDWNQIQVTDRAPAGYVYYWVLAPEVGGTS